MAGIHHLSDSSAKLSSHGLFRRRDTFHNSCYPLTRRVSQEPVVYYV